MYITHFIQLNKSKRRQGGNSTLGAGIVVPDFQCSNCIFDGKVNNVPVLKPVVMMVMSDERTCNNQAALKILKKMGILLCSTLYFGVLQRFNIPRISSVQSLSDDVIVCYFSAVGNFMLDVLPVKIQVRNGVNFWYWCPGCTERGTFYFIWFVESRNLNWKLQLLSNVAFWEVLL